MRIDTRPARLSRLLFSLFASGFILSVVIGCGSTGSGQKTNNQPTSTPDLSSCPSSVPADSPTGYWPLNTQSFQGIFQFLGQTNPKNASNPEISGADLEWSWAQIEPAEGHYNWLKVDQDIKIWTQQAKPVILRFSAGGQIKWGGTMYGSYTPSWVFDTYGVQRITETNGTVFPEYWNPTYLQMLTEFVNAAATRYDNNPFVAAVEIGIGQGGETEPDGVASNNPKQLQLWQTHGYTNALWWSTLQKIVKIYEAAWQRTPLALMVTSTFLQSNDHFYDRQLVEQYAVNQGLWLQINSLDNSMPTSILNGKHHYTTTIEEQKQSAQDSGYPAIDDVKHGIELGARYLLIFAADLTNPANADALSYAVQHKGTTSALSDCSGHGLTLSAQGRVAPVPGVSGLANSYAQFFDGTTASLFATQAPLSDRAQWSLEGWLYPTALPQTEAIAVMNGADGAQGGGFSFGIAGGSTGGSGSHLVAYFPGVGWIDSGYTFSTTRQWYHVIVTRDGNLVRFYVNGVRTQNTSTLLPKAASAHFSIGSSFDFQNNIADHFFTGAIDKVSVYSYALSQSKVASHFTNSKSTV